MPRDDSALFRRLKLTYDEPLSNVLIQFQLAPLPRGCSGGEPAGPVYEELAESHLRHPSSGRARDCLLALHRQAHVHRRAGVLGSRRGWVVQVEQIQPVLKASGFTLLRLICNEPLAKLTLLSISTCAATTRHNGGSGAVPASILRTFSCSTITSASMMSNC